jgi:hypothetical protein
MQATTQQKEKLAKKAIEALISGQAFTKDCLPQAGHRSLLLHALDSSNPHLMTKAFLVGAEDLFSCFELFIIVLEIMSQRF